MIAQRGTTDSAPPAKAKVLSAFLALYLIWGSTYLFIKWVVADIPPFLTGAARNSIAGGLLYVWARSRGAQPPTRKQMGVSFLVGTMLLGFGNGSVNLAIQYVPSGLTALIVSSVPIWMVVVDWLRPRGSAPHGKVVAGLILGFLGIGVLIWSAGGIGAQTTGVSVTLLACGALLLGSMSWASGSILSRHLPRHPDGGLATALEMASAGFVLLVFGAISGEVARFDPGAVSSGSWWALAYLIVFGSVIGFSAYTWLLRVSTPAKVSTYAYVNPLVAVALGSAFAGERLTTGTLAGAALILGAVVMITLPDRAALRQVFGGG